MHNWLRKHFIIFQNVPEMSGLTKEQLAIDHYDMTFPTEYTLAGLSHGITKDNCYRKYLESQTEVKKFIPIWNSKLVGNPPMIPSGKNRATILFEVLQDIWDNNEKARACPSTPLMSLYSIDVHLIHSNLQLVPNVHQDHRRIISYCG